MLGPHLPNKCQIHRCYTLVCTAYSWFVCLHMKCINLLHLPRRQINIDSNGAPVNPIILECMNWRKRFESEHLIFHPPSISKRTLSLPVLFADIRIVSTWQIKMAFYCEIPMRIFVTSSSKNAGTVMRIFSFCSQPRSLYYCIFGNQFQVDFRLIRHCKVCVKKL